MFDNCRDSFFQQKREKRQSSASSMKKGRRTYSIVYSNTVEERIFAKFPEEKVSDKETYYYVFSFKP